MSYADRIYTALAAVRHRFVLYMAGRALRIILLGVIVFFLAIVPLCYAMHMPAAAILVLGAFAGIAVAGALILLCAMPLRHVRSLVHTGRFIERIYPEFNGELISAIEFLNNPAQLEQFGLSQQFVDLHVQRTAHALPSTADSMQRCGDPLRLWLLCIGLIVAPVLFFSDFYADAIYQSYRNVCAPHNEVAAILEVRPGDCVVTYGADLRIVAVSTVPDATPQITIYAPHAEPLEAALSTQTAILSDYVMKNVTQQLQYEISAGAVTRGPYDVQVVYKPVIVAHSLIYTYPAYTGWDTKIEKRQQFDAITALAGTAITLDVVSSTPVSSGWLHLVHADKKIPFEHIDGCRATVTLHLTEPDEYTVHLIDRYGQHNNTLRPFALTPVTDLPPSVAILEPAPHIEMPREMTVDIAYSVTDDIGLSGVSLKYGVDAEPSEMLALDHTAGIRNREDTYTWHLTTLRLSPGQSVSYRLVAADTLPAPDGPQLGESPVYTISFPSIAQMYKRRTELYDEPMESIRSLFEEHSMMLEQIEQIERKLEQSDSLSWSDRTMLDTVLDNQQQLQQQLSLQGEQLKQQMDKLDVAQDIVDQYKQIQNMLDNLLTDEMKQRLNELREMIEQSDAFSTMQQQIGAMKMDMQEYRANLERTIELLKNLSLQHQVQELSNAVNAALDAQENLDNLLQEWNEQPVAQHDAAQRQAESLDSLLASLNEGLDNLSADAAGARQEITDAINDLKEKYGDEQLRDALERMQSAMQQSQPGAAREQCSMMSGSLSAMSAALQNLLSALAMNAFMRNHIVDVIGRTLRMSNELHEVARVMERTKGKNAEQNIVQAQKMYFIEQELKRIAQLGKELGEESILIEPPYYDDLLNAADTLSHNNERVFKKGDQTVIPIINDTVVVIQQVAHKWVMLLETLNAMQQSGSGQGQMPADLQDFFDQLNQMAHTQQKLNEQTQAAMGQTPGMSMQQYMQQLATEQRMLSQALSSLQNKYGQDKRIIGDLGKLASEMQQAANQIEAQQLGSELIERQQQILTRLLEAQRSARKRDKSNKREAQTAEDSAVESPAALDESLLQPTFDRPVTTGPALMLPGEYKELVDDYFMLLRRNK